MITAVNTGDVVQTESGVRYYVLYDDKNARVPSVIALDIDGIGNTVPISKITEIISHEYERVYGFIDTLYNMDKLERSLG